MQVYIHGSEGRPPPAEHMMFVTPAADPRIAGKDAAESSWVDAANKPITHQVLFRHGRAEVDDALGRYMVKHGLASRTQLFTPHAA